MLQIAGLLKEIFLINKQTSLFPYFCPNADLVITEHLISKQKGLSLVYADNRDRENPCCNNCLRFLSLSPIELHTSDFALQQEFSKLSKLEARVT